MKKTLLVLLALTFGSLALYSIIPSDKPSNSIVGNWLLTDYKYEPLTEEGKGFEIDLESKVNAKTIYSFTEEGTSRFGDNSSKFYFVKDSATVYIWSANDFAQSTTVSEEIKNHERTQKMLVTIENNKMHMVLESIHYKITLILTR